jgi:hypothetical protein
MAVVAALLDAPGRRPDSVTWATLAIMAVGGGTLVCASVIGGVLFTGAAHGWFSVLVALVAVVQVSAGVLLLVGGARLAMGRSRREVAAGVVLLFVTCGAYASYALTSEDGRAVLLVAGGFAAAGAGVLFLALRPAVGVFLSR